jgi:hypothetical protein
MAVTESLDRPELVLLWRLSLWLEILVAGGYFHGVLAPTRAFEVAGGRALA